VIPIVIVIILHEGIHALCLRLFTGEWPIVIASLEGLGGIAVRLPSWYLPRNAFLISNLAPVCTMTPVGVAPFTDSAPRIRESPGLLQRSQSRGSLPDLVSPLYVYLHPATAYITTDGRIYHHPRSESVARWKQQLRSLMEGRLARLN
jgi:hypothetical protein